MQRTVKRTIDRELEERYISNSSMTIDDFFDTVKELIDAAWGDGWGVFVDDAPTGTDPEKLSLPMITYDTTREPSEAFKTPRPRLFHGGTSETSPGESIFVYRQWFDYTVTFKIWTKTNRECSQLMRRLEDLLLSYSGYLKACGVQEITFQKEGPDIASDKGGQDLISKMLRYLVRIERITVVRKNNLKEVIEKVYVKAGVPVPQWVTSGDIPLPNVPNASQ